MQLGAVCLNGLQCARLLGGVSNAPQFLAQPKLTSAEEGKPNFSQSLSNVSRSSGVGTSSGPNMPFLMSCSMANEMVCPRPAVSWAPHERRPSNVDSSNEKKHSLDNGFSEPRPYSRGVLRHE